jgi:hypothetical protein
MHGVYFGFAAEQEFSARIFPTERGALPLRRKRKVAFSVKLKFGFHNCSPFAPALGSRVGASCFV